MTQENESSLQEGMQEITPDQTGTSEAAATQKAPTAETQAGGEQPETDAPQQSAQTMEKQTVEQANEAYTGESQSDAPASDQAESKSPFDPPKEPEATANAVPVNLPDDPFGIVVLGLVREALRNRIPAAQSGALHDLLNMVAKDDTTLRAVCVVQRRLLKHLGTGKVTVEALGAVLQGDEAERFAERELPSRQLLAFYQEITPEVARLIATRT